jgi:valyl-tRNA synthetase
LQITDTLAQKPDKAVGQVISGGIEIYLPLAGMIDLAAEQQRLQKELASLEQRINGSRAKLNNAGFVAKAPAEVVQQERDRLADLELQLDKVQGQLAALGS